MKKILIDSLKVYLEYIRLFLISLVFISFIVFPLIGIVILASGVSGWFGLLFLVYIYCFIVAIKLIIKYESEIAGWLE